jgi:hypothetical protein
MASGHVDIQTRFVQSLRISQRNLLRPTKIYSTPDLAALSLMETDNCRHKKRPTESDHYARRSKAPDHTANYNPDCSNNVPRERANRPRALVSYLVNPSIGAGLLLHPDSRPISQEQLASEVKSIYAGLTMVENKCIHVDRALNDDPNSSNSINHWQALIDIHRNSFHELHDLQQLYYYSKCLTSIKGFLRIRELFQPPVDTTLHTSHDDQSGIPEDYRIRDTISDDSHLDRVAASRNKTFTSRYDFVQRIANRWSQLLKLGSVNLAGSYTYVSMLQAYASCNLTGRELPSSPCDSHMPFKAAQSLCFGRHSI